MSLHAPTARRHRPATRVAALVCLTLATACYSNVPVSHGATAPNGDVRVAIRAEAAPALVPRLGPRVEAVAGRLVTRNDSAMTVLVTRVARSGGTEESWPSEQIALPLTAVREIQTRRLSMGRSAVAAGSAVVAMFLIGRGVGSGSDDGGSRPDVSPGK